MEVVIPPDIVANETEWTLVDFSGIQQSALSGMVRTISRGQRWQARVMYHDLIDDKRAAMMTLVARLRGKANRCWVWDPAYKMRGSFPTSELLTNPTFNALTGWSAFNSVTLKAGNREAQMISTGTGVQGIYQAVSLTAAVAYVLRGCLLDGVGTDGITLGCQWAQGATINSAASTTLRGMLRAAAVANSTTSWTVYAGLLSTGVALADIGMVQYASLSRCALVVNPSALVCFTSCLIDALPASTNGLLLAGDRVEINGELKTVTADVNSAGDGSAQLMFEPAMRVPIIPDNSPVVIFNPMMRGVLTSDVAQPSRPGGLKPFSDFDMTFIEA